MVRRLSVPGEEGIWEFELARATSFMCCGEAINSKSSHPSPLSKVLVYICRCKALEKNFQISTMRGCHNRYAYTENDDCSTHHSTSIFYFISTIAAMVVLGSITLLFFCCIYYKRRRIAERLRNARNRGQQIPSANSPVIYVWPGTADEAAGPISQATPTAALAEANYNISKGVAAGSEPVSCVIMAGEERPTHLAKPLPSEDFVHVRLDRKVDELERGKRTQS